MALRKPSRTPVPLLAALLGLTLVFSVSGWKIFGASYAGDVETLCEAETRSGVKLDRSMAGVSEWVRSHLATREGGLLFASLRDEPLGERGRDLAARARELRLPNCPLSHSFEALTEEAECRADLQSLCSRFTFPGIAQLPIADRVQRILEWAENSGGKEKLRVLGAAMERAGPPRESARLLREAAAEADLHSCDMARILENESMPAYRSTE